MEVITTLTLEDIHQILLDEMRHWRMHFKTTLDKWLTMVGCRAIEKETGDGTFASIDDKGEKEFDYCGICDVITNAMKYGKDQKVLFYWSFNTAPDEYTLKNIDAPDTLKWGADFAISLSHEDKDTDKCQLPKLKNGEVVITSKRKLYINFITCARYMAFVKEADDDNRMLESWVIDACLPLIKSDCKNADLYSVEWLPFTGVDKCICKAEAMGILLNHNQLPKKGQIVIEYECDPKGIVIHAPKLATEDGKELPDLDLYSEPITYLPSAAWIEVPRKEKLIPSNEIIEGFWTIKNDRINTYSQWLMMSASAAIQINLGGADSMVGWNENEAPITWHDALEKLMADCDSSNEFKVTYSLEHLLEDKGAYSYRQLNIYSCEPVKK